MQILALIASIIVGLQAIAGLIFGTIICPNAGCKVVESLTVIPPLYLNLLGSHLHSHSGHANISGIPTNFREEATHESKYH
jgi:tetrahydromethanopterin S-methyltransferase subunit E